MPKDLAKWIAEDSLERFVSDTIDYLIPKTDWTRSIQTHGRTAAGGRPSIRVDAQSTVFGYAIGVRSSRKLDRLRERDVAFRYLAANQHPDFRTFSKFRKDNREEFEHLFEEVLRLCREAGLADLGEVALDGRRVQGGASLDANRTRKNSTKRSRRSSMKPLRSTQTKTRSTAQKIAGTSSRRTSGSKKIGSSGYATPSNTSTPKINVGKTSRLRRSASENMEEAEMGREKRGRKPTPPEEVELPDDKKANTTDPKSQTLKTSSGWVQGYNEQAMVDCDNQVIVAADVTNYVNDVQQLEPMLATCEEVNRKRPRGRLPTLGTGATQTPS